MQSMKGKEKVDNTAVIRALAHAAPFACLPLYTRGGAPFDDDDICRREPCGVVEAICRFATAPSKPDTNERGCREGEEKKTGRLCNTRVRIGKYPGEHTHPIA